MKYVYRVVNVLLALAVFPTLYFVDLIYAEMSVSLIKKAAVYESLSIKEIVDIFTGKSDYSALLSIFKVDTSSVFKWPQEFNILNTRLIIIGVLLAVMLLSALFIFIFSCVSGKRIPVLVSSAVGLISIIAANIVFKSVAAEFTSGNINIVKALSGGGLIQSLVGSAVNIDSVRFAGFQNAEIMIFAGLITWTAIFYLSELGDTEKK